MRRTSGALEDEDDEADELDTVALLPVEAVPDFVDALEALEVVAGVVRTLEVAFTELVAGFDVEGGRTVDAASTPGIVQRKAKRQKARTFHRVAIA